ncbi:uncharacterized protein [Temnothorax nylanderi]|uniref:uncharacterized protein n=1 Tax=Temnothorax nylanderi TaxID=102681 RepID=UPI003A841B6E
MNDEVNDERPLRKHFTQKVKRATEDLTKMASIEKLRNRIIAPNMTNSISNREYVDVQVSENSILDHDISPHEMWNNVTEENEPQNINISQEVTFEREQGANNEEAFDLSDNEIVFQNEIDQEDDASEGSNDDDDIDDDEDINENQFETEEQKANYVAENLREWAVYDGNISKKKLDNLLLRLNPIFPTLPKSYKTLLRTPKHLDIHVLPDGSMLWYKGIVRNLNGMLLNEYLNKFGNIIIDVNMDGLPITKSTRLKFWPVLGRLVHTDNDPFLISLYLGEWDPIDVHSYLHDFVTEVEHLLEHGYMNNDFIVAKFLPTSEDDNVYYEVALAKWLVRINEEMKGILLWPNNDAVAGKLVRSEAKADETWRQLEVEVKRYYETYIAARNAAKGFEEFASAYESDSNSKMGRGMRRKRIMKLSSSDDDLSDSDVKKSRKQNKSKIAAAPLPPPPPPAGSSRTKSLSCASKENIPIIKVISNKKQRKEVTSSASTTAIIKHQPQQKHPLLDKIVNLRQQAADKAQQRKQAMCLENIQKVSMKRKATNSTLCSELPMKVSETDGSSRSETHSTPILLNSQSEKSYNSESNDIQSILPQSPCRSLDENQNPCSSFTRDDVQIPLKPSSKFK